MTQNTERCEIRPLGEVSPRSDHIGRWFQG